MPLPFWVSCTSLFINWGFQGSKDEISSFYKEVYTSRCAHINLYFLIIMLIWKISWQVYSFLYPAVDIIWSLVVIWNMISQGCLYCLSLMLWVYLMTSLQLLVVQWLLYYRAEEKHKIFDWELSFTVFV